MGSVWMLIKGCSPPARRSLAHPSNNSLFHTDGTAPTILLELTDRDLTIGSDKSTDLTLDACHGRIECGWIALQHCTLRAAGADVIIQNLASSPFQYRPELSNLEIHLARGSTGTLQAGTYVLRLAESWEFECSVLGSPLGEQSQIPCRVSSSSTLRTPLPKLKRPKVKAMVDPFGVVVLHRTKVCEVRLVVRGPRRVVEKACVDRRRANDWVNEINVIRKLRHVRRAYSLQNFGMVLIEPQENIITIIDYQKTPLPVFQTPFIGPDLGMFQGSDHMATFTVEEGETILGNMGLALADLKSKGIVHHDIKPKNILWDRYARRAVMIDFGQARKQSECTADATFGTPCFLPPEVSLGIKRSYAGDMWALGVVLMYVFRYISGDFKSWELKADSRDFKKHKEWINLIESKRKLLPKGSVIRKMLERDPAKRIQAEDLNVQGTRIVT